MQLFQLANIVTTSKALVARVDPHPDTPTNQRLEGRLEQSTLWVAGHWELLF